MYEIPSDLRLIPGDDEDVNTLAPVEAAPKTIFIPAISLSACKQSPPTLGIFFAKYSESSVWGVIG
jgi:hypothetical protein